MRETKIVIEAGEKKIVLEAPFEMHYLNWIAFIDHVKQFKACPESY